MTLLGAAILIPAVCFYLSKYLANQGRAIFRRQRPAQRIGSRFIDNHRAPDRLGIPISKEAPDIYDEPCVPRQTAEATRPEQPEAPPALFVGSSERDRFHVPACRWAGQIQEAHRISFETRQAALDRGYAPCGSCKP